MSITREIFDEKAGPYLEGILERPGMYAGPSIQALEIVLLNVLNVRAVVFDLDHDPREVLRKTYLERFGHSAGAGGPAFKLIERLGDEPAHEEVRGFYKVFTEAVLSKVR